MDAARATLATVLLGALGFLAWRMYGTQAAGAQYAPPEEYAGDFAYSFDAAGADFAEYVPPPQPEPFMPNWASAAIDTVTAAAGGIFGNGGDAVTIAGTSDNVAAFLAMIRAAEGTSAPNGYRYLFGSTYTNEKLFDSFADHPRIRSAFRQTDGVTNYTTAAGAYQFLASTWDGVRSKLGLVDFSPASQDAGAVELIRQRGALADVIAGRFDAAVRKVATIWASLPGSPYAQRTRSRDFVLAAYVNAGGAYV